jgi:hypothetical protein
MKSYIAQILAVAAVMAPLAVGATNALRSPHLSHIRRRAMSRRGVNHRELLSKHTPPQRPENVLARKPALADNTGYQEDRGMG